LRKELRSDVKSDAFQAALDARLQELPFVLQQLTQQVEEVQLLRDGFITTVVAVPRELVVRALSSHLIRELRESAELQRSFRRHPEIFLRRVGVDAEQVWCEARLPLLFPKVGLAGRSVILAAVDKTFDWGVRSPRYGGHYYVAPNEMQSKLSKTLRSSLVEEVQREKQRLGEATLAEVTAAYAEAQKSAEPWILDAADLG
jgi:hypothetical protein